MDIACSKLFSENNIHQEIIRWAAIYPNNSSTLHIPFSDQVLLGCSSATVPRVAELTLNTEKTLKLILLVITMVAGADLTSSAVHSVIFAHSVEFVLVMGFYFVGINDIWKWQSCVTTRARQFGFITWMIIAYYCCLYNQIMSFNVPESMEWLVIIVAQKLLYACICGSTSMRTPTEVTTAAHATSGNSTSYVGKGCFIRESAIISLCSM